MPKITITQEEKYHFDFLNELRDSGVTNMWGATPYLMDEFTSISDTQAKKSLVKWMDNFNSDGYEDLLKK
jgi:hypothetical protein